jgi:hypothetical protein
LFRDYKSSKGSREELIDIPQGMQDYSKFDNEPFDLIGMGKHPEIWLEARRNFVA